MLTFSVSHTITCNLEIGVKTQPHDQDYVSPLGYVKLN